MRAALPSPSRTLSPTRPTRTRRGVTLVEMLVVVALVVLMMTILVQIFQSATGAMSASRAIQELDVTLRAVDLRIKQDLLGCTAKFTPPLDPARKLGYFEYGENAFADLQGEDTDDYLAFTTKAPEGQVFTGRVYVKNAWGTPGASIQPITITSQLAEIVYFLRNGNLYRRVFLIVPERDGTLLTAGQTAYFPGLAGNMATSWIAVNDISARPNTNVTLAAGLVSPIPNDLGDLTNRENRAFRPRFRADYYTIGNPGGGVRPDGVDDDFNTDDVPDLYPSLYPNLLATYYSTSPPGTSPSNLIHQASLSQAQSIATSNYDVLAFPYIYPGMYSQPEPSSANTGWIHSLDPSHASYVKNLSTGLFDTGNHSPLFGSDNQNTPDFSKPAQTQTWWGFPTWRETLSPNWKDPLVGLNLSNNPPTQVVGLSPFPPGSVPPSNSSNLLPPMNGQFGANGAQYANDGAGSPQFAALAQFAGVWEDDLILSNVRSFDVKAYDTDAPYYSNATVNPPFLSPAGYYDLGYGIKGNTAFANTTPNFLWDDNNQPRGFGHAGRIPPLGTPFGTPNPSPTTFDDYRLNPSRPINPNNPTTDFRNFGNFVGDNATGVIRLTRVFDTWSTDYSNAPDIDVSLYGLAANYNSNNPAVPANYLPIYPSYPAPYTSPLRGIQIQIRVADPRNERAKVLTIRQDFTDKLN